ncbi:prominin-1-like [Argonauta hians]
MDALNHRYLFNKRFDMLFIIIAVAGVSMLVFPANADTTNNYAVMMNVTWDDYPNGDPNRRALTYDRQGLNIFNEMTRSFVYNTLSSTGVEIYLKIKNKKIDVAYIKELVLENIGFIVAVVFGLVFVPIFTFTGMFFCCCRLCGNCGGRRIQKKPKPSCRTLLSLFLFLNIAICTAGCACMLMSLSQIKRNVEAAPETIDKTIEYAKSYTTEIFDQFLYLKNKTDTLLLDTLLNNFDNIDTTLGQKIQNDIDSKAQVVPLFTDIRNSFNSLKNVQVMMEKTDNSTEDLKLAVTKLNSSLVTLKNDIKAKDPNFTGVDSIGVGFDPSSLPDLKSSMKTIDTTINNGVLEGSIEPGEKAFNDTPETIVLIAFACVTVLIPLLQLFGLLFGICGNGAKVKPTQRNCLSNCGGILLMSSVGFMFIFGWIFMILTTITYIPGSIVEFHGCSFIRNIGSGKIDEVIAIVTGNPNYIRNFTKTNVNVTISELYSKCKNGESLFSAMGLEGYIKNALEDFEKQAEVEKKINGINVSLDHIKIRDSNLDNWFIDLKSGLDINMNDISSHFQTSPVSGGFDQLIDALEKRTQTDQSYQPLLTQAQNIKKNEVQNVTNLKKPLQNNFEALENQTKDISKTFDGLYANINATQDFFDNQAVNVSKTRLKLFANDLLDVISNSVSNVLTLLNKIFPCQPAVFLFEYLTVDIACGTVDAFNGFWFGFGWFVVFFIPGVIFSVKLAKYFRRMNTADEFDPSGIPMQQFGNTGGDPYRLASNKVVPR